MRIGPIGVRVLVGFAVRNCRCSPFASRPGAQGHEFDGVVHPVAVGSIVRAVEPLGDGVGIERVRNGHLELEALPLVSAVGGPCDRRVVRRVGGSALDQIGVLRFDRVDIGCVQRSPSGHRRIVGLVGSEEPVGGEHAAGEWQDDRLDREPVRERGGVDRSGAAEGDETERSGVVATLDGH